MTLLRPPGPVLEIAATLERAGFETWCVGGAVRDALLGHPDLDWDLATAATPPQMQRLFRRTVPVGIEHGTVGVLDRNGRMHEVTTFRRDVQTDGRHAKVEFGVSIVDDLARRDFTINAIAYSASRDELLDPFGGRADLEAKLVRAVGVPDERMREDRLRALRAIRFAGRFDFDIEADTWRAIVASAPHLGRLSAERVHQELEKTLEQTRRPSRSLGRWIESGAMAALVPALATADAVTLASLDCLSMPGDAKRPERAAGRRKNRLTALFLGRTATETQNALRSLKFSNTDVAWISALAERWLRLGPEMERVLTDAHRAPSLAQLRRWAAMAGRVRLASVLRLAAARWTAMRDAGLPAPSARQARALYRDGIRVAYRDPIEIGDLAVDGDDLLSAGVPAGRAIGKILLWLLDAVLDDPALNSRVSLLALVPRLLVRLAEEGRDDDPRNRMK